MKYTATRNIDHNGKRYEEGEQIELDDDHADPLLACGAVVDPQAPAEGAPPAATKKRGGRK